MDDDFSDVEEDAPELKKEHDYDARFRDSEEFACFKAAFDNIIRLFWWFRCAAPHAIPALASPPFSKLSRN